jgi:hypothetical protein
VAVSYCLSEESIALRKLGFGEAPFDGEFFLLREQANRKRDLKAWSYGAVRSCVAQVQPPLDADKPPGHAIHRELLRICCSQLTEMLNDRRLATFKICQAPPDGAKRIRFNPPRRAAPSPLLPADWPSGTS